MLSEKISDEQIRQYLSIIEETSNDLDKIVGDFLSFAKPRQPLLKEILVSEVIRSIKMMLETIISSNGIVLNIEFAEKEKAVLGDENQIKQVVLNIVKNAIEAMSEQEKPKLNINTIFSESMKEMVIAISDNGKGMSPEETEKIGVPFHTTKEKGTGLGMSISYQIIREHNGRIKIESSLGKGTTFYVALPCKAG